MYPGEGNIVSTIPIDLAKVSFDLKPILESVILIDLRP